MILINNPINKAKSRNQYELGHKYCKFGSIMIVLDGDDPLIGRQVFTLVNAIFQKRNTRFLYFNHLTLRKKDPDGKWRYHLGWSIYTPEEVKKQRSYRTWKRLPTQLRCWTSDLFLSISFEKFTRDGEFVMIGEDIPLMYNLQEMAGDKVQYVPLMVYEYVDQTGNNDGRNS